jgi:flagellar assembly protein FliH
MSTSSRSVLRGERTIDIDAHAFEAVDDLPRPSSVRPVATGDARVDAIHGAAWADGVARGEVAGRESGFEEGHRDGFDVGRREGRAAGAAEAQAAAESAIAARVADALAALDHAAAELRAREEVAVADIEAEVVALAIGLAAAILQREVALAADPARDALRRALQMAPARGDVVARLSPDDVASLGDLAALAPGRSVEVVADPSIARGSCIVHAGASLVDASFDGALARARVALLGRTDGAAG